MKKTETKEVEKETNKLTLPNNTPIEFRDYVAEYGKVNGICSSNGDVNIGNALKSVIADNEEMTSKGVQIVIDVNNRNKDVIEMCNEAITIASSEENKDAIDPAVIVYFKETYNDIKDTINKNIDDCETFLSFNISATYIKAEKRMTFGACRARFLHNNNQ